MQRNYGHPKNQNIQRRRINHEYYKISVDRKWRHVLYKALFRQLFDNRLLYE